MLCCVGVVSWWRVYYIKCEPECLIKHGGNNSVEKRTVEFKAGIGVDLDEPGVEVSIDHKIEAKDLKIMFFPFS